MSLVAPSTTPHTDHVILCEKRVDKIFNNMDRDKDAKLTFDEFVEGSKQDPTIVQVRTAIRNSRSVFPLTICFLGLILVRRSCVTHPRLWYMIPSPTRLRLDCHFTIQYFSGLPGRTGCFDFPFPCVASFLCSTSGSMDMYRTSCSAENDRSRPAYNRCICSKNHCAGRIG